MANAKYNNLTVMMTTGQLNWARDSIQAFLMTDVTYRATDVTVADVGGSRMQVVPISRRAVAADGSLLGSAVSFGNMPKDTDFQMLIAKDGGPGTVPSLLAFYNSDADDVGLRLKNNGTLIVRPEQTLPAEDIGLGVWIGI